MTQAQLVQGVNQSRQGVFDLLKNKERFFCLWGSYEKGKELYTLLESRLIPIHARYDPEKKKNVYPFFTEEEFLNRTKNMLLLVPKNTSSEEIDYIKSCEIHYETQETIEALLEGTPSLDWFSMFTQGEEGFKQELSQLIFDYGLLQHENRKDV